MPSPSHIRRIITTFNEVDPLLSNSTARHFYYNKLVVANGGVEDFHTYYGVSLATFKTAINTVFDSFNSLGLTSKIKRWTPRIGSIAATQRLNAITEATTYDGTFVGGVTFSTEGAIFNGTTGYEDTKYAQSVWGNTTINLGVSFMLVANSFSGDMTIMGANTSGTFTEIRHSGGLLYNFLGLPDFMDSITVENKFYTYNRISQTNTTFKDGVLINNNSGFTNNTLGAEKMLIGAMNTDGVISRYADCTLRNEIFHDGLTAQETEDLYTILSTFDTALER
jgi:hypothetical protein